MASRNTRPKDYRMKNIASALVKAQKAFGPALKTSTNPHFKSRYADLAACVEAVMDGLNANGIALIQKLYEHADGVMVETIFLHESGETYECGIIFVPATKHDPQGYGSALTYARRYSLMAACGIAPEDDDGNLASKKSKVDLNALADHLINIEGCTTNEELKSAYMTAYAACNGDSVWQKKVIAAKDKAKAQI